MSSTNESDSASVNDLTEGEVDRRMAAAARAEDQGEYREATDLYDALGRDIQARYGRFDGRALDAFEGVARAIRKGAEDDSANGGHSR